MTVLAKLVNSTFFTAILRLATINKVHRILVTWSSQLCPDYLLFAVLLITKCKTSVLTIDFWLCLASFTDYITTIHHISSKCLKTCIILSLTPCKCSEANGNKDSMRRRWLRQLHRPHLKV